MYRNLEYLPSRSGMSVWSRLVAYLNLLYKIARAISLVAETACERDRQGDRSGESFRRIGRLSYREAGF